MNRVRSLIQDFRPLKSTEGRQTSLLDSAALGLQGVPRLGAIISLYKSDKFIESLAENLLSQESLDLVDVRFLLVQPSCFERTVVEKLNRSLPNSSTTISEEPKSIYRAWNEMIEGLATPYITNVNADDLRHPQSFKDQIQYMDWDTSIAAAYSDYFEVTTHFPTWDEAEKNGRHIPTGEATVESLVLRGKNPLHAAPVWRRRLHEEFGLFNENLTSAGDVEFWIRCLVEGERMRKMPGRTYAYFKNPQGLSSKFLSRGPVEHAEILLYYRNLLSGSSP